MTRVHSSGNNVNFHSYSVCYYLEQYIYIHIRERSSSRGDLCHTYIEVIKVLHFFASSQLTKFNENYIVVF
jgi:hypothetical protein